jgi:hypothetical protein
MAPEQGGSLVEGRALVTGDHAEAEQGLGGEP